MTKKEVSDKFIITLLIVAVVVSVVGAYIIYDYSSSYKFSQPQIQSIKEDFATGSVILNVVEITNNGDKNNEYNK